MRREIKYKLDLYEASSLEKVLDKVLSKDSNADSNGEYVVKTIYFENYLGEITNDKKRKINNISKYRIRMYQNDSKSIFLERKTNCSGIIKKESEKISKNYVDKLLKGDLYHVSDSESLLKTSLYLQMILKHLRPFIIIEYNRKAYVDEMSNTRITLDRNIKSTLDCESFFANSYNESIDNYVILEVKYERFVPSFIKDLLKALDKNQISNSKFENEMLKINI